MNYAFPLPECQPHTYEWEDGPHDTCYRCGADRPEAKGDRDALAKEHATASNTENLNKETDMHNSTDTFAAGTRVRDMGNNRSGTVESAPHSQYPGMVPVIWDETEAEPSFGTFAAPSVLELLRSETASEPGSEAVRHGSTPSEGVRPYSGVELRGEARRRGLPVAPLTNAAGNIEPPLPTTDAE